MTFTFTADVAVFSSRVSQQATIGEELLQEVGQAPLDRLLSKTKNWHERNVMLLSAAFNSDSVWSPSPAVDYRQYVTLPIAKPVEIIDPSEVTEDALRDTIEKLVSRLQTINDLAGTYPTSGSLPASGSSKVEATAINDREPCIFIIHGRSEAPRVSVQRLLERAMNSSPIILLEQPNGGSTLIEKLERNLGTLATYAVVIMTGDDVGGLDGQQQQIRARQNVIFEAGYALACLGRNRVTFLHGAGVEVPTDLDGIAYHALDEHGAWKAALLRELKSAGMAVDTNVLLSP